MNKSITTLCNSGGPRKLSIEADGGQDWDESEYSQELDWFGLLPYEQEYEDSVTGQRFYDCGHYYEYHGLAATLARILWQQLSNTGKAADKVAHAVEAKVCEAGDDIETILARLLYPEVALPGQGVRIRKSAHELGQLLSAKKTHFLRGGVVSKVTKKGSANAEIEEVKAQAMRSDFETVATPVKLIQTRAGDIYRHTVCGENDAKAIMACSDFRNQLPELKVVTNCPVLVEKNGGLKAISGYNREAGIYANGKPVPVVNLHIAVKLLSDMLKGFNFVTPSDRSRALAALITPALVMGGLLKGRAALDLGEADKSQSGKGYRHKLTAAIYRELVHSATGGSGISKLDEAFDMHVLHGRPFISLDNIRGKIDSMKIESFLTEDTYVARVAFRTPTVVDPRRTCVMLTSNKAEISPDLANRCSCVRIEKQPEGYKFLEFPEGDILDHVRANQPLYLGAVFAVIMHWHGKGKPKTDETRHDFVEWRRLLDWIVRNVFQAAPLLDGHKETQQRMVSPELTWLRELILLVEQEGRSSEWLAASQLMGMLDDAGLEVPGLKEGEWLAEDYVTTRCQQMMGIRLAKCFRSVGKPIEDDPEASDAITIDGLVIQRKEYNDLNGRGVKSYRVFRNGNAPPQDMQDLPF